MISTKVKQKGRFGNKFIRNIIKYLISKKTGIIPIYETDIDCNNNNSFDLLGLNFEINNNLIIDKELPKLNSNLIK